MTLSKFSLTSSPKYLPCSIKYGFVQLGSQESIQYIQQVLLKLMLLATVLAVRLTNQYTVFRERETRGRTTLLSFTIGRHGSQTATVRESWKSSPAGGLQFVWIPLRMKAAREKSDAKLVGPQQSGEIHRGKHTMD